MDALHCPDEEVLAAFIDGALDPAEEEGLHRHLDGCSSCRRLLAGLARDLTGPSNAAPPEHDNGPPGPGTRIGRFVVRGLLGRGAMGLVLRAEDTELDRDVAIKLVTPRADAPSGLVELREARALARISHPNVVEIYDVGIFGGRLFVAMELLTGRTLRAWVSEEAPSLTRRLDVLVQLADGLGAVHDVGMVHRDFKPANVMVGPDERAWIVDFGLARLQEDNVTASSGRSATGPSSITRTGDVIGTPAYMAPEQLRGRPADARSDQFAFCVAAWEILGGQRPFSGRTTTDVLAAIEAGVLPRGDGNPPHALAAVLRRGLSPRADDRFGSMAALAEALLHAARPRRARRLIAVAVGAAAVAMIGVASASRDGPCKDLPPPPTAWPEVAAAFGKSGLPDAGVRLARVEQALTSYAGDLAATRDLVCDPSEAGDPQGFGACVQASERRLQALVETLGSSGPDALREADAAVAALPQLEQCRRDPTAAGIDETVPESVRARLEQSRALVTLGRYEEAVARIDETAPSAGALAPDFALLRGLALRRLGRAEDALSSLREAYFDARPGQWRAATRAALEAATLLGLDLGRMEVAHEWIEHAEAAAPETGRQDPSFRASILDARGQLLVREGELDAALAAFEEALQGATTDDDRATYLSHVSSVRFARGEYAACLPLQQEVLRLEENEFGPHHLNVIHTRTTLAAILQNLGRIDEARAEYEDTMRIATRSLGEDHPALADLWTNLGGLQLTVGERNAAIASYEKGIEIYGKVYGTDHPSYAGAMANLGNVQRRLGNFDEALRLHHAAVTAATGPGPEYALWRATLAVSQWLAGDPAAGAATMADAANTLEAAMTAGTRLVWVLRLHLCWMYLDQGDRQQAEPMCDRAAELAAQAELLADDAIRLARTDVWRRRLAGETVAAKFAEIKDTDEIDRHVAQAMER